MDLGSARCVQSFADEGGAIYLFEGLSAAPAAACDASVAFSHSAVSRQAVPAKRSVKKPKCPIGPCRSADSTLSSRRVLPYQPRIAATARGGANRSSEKL